MLDAAKLADELRAEQEAAQGLEHDRKDLETRAHEMQVSLDEAEANAIKWGRKMVAKLETRAYHYFGDNKLLTSNPCLSDSVGHELKVAPRRSNGSHSAVDLLFYGLISP